jgi:hypothetical protein
MEQNHAFLAAVEAYRVAAKEAWAQVQAFYPIGFKGRTRSTPRRRRERPVEIVGIYLDHYDPKRAPMLQVRFLDHTGPRGNRCYIDHTEFIPESSGL